MKVGDYLYFSKCIKFSDLDLDNIKHTVNAFQTRVEEFYLCPARNLLKNKYAFAGGVLCCACIDFLAHYSSSNTYNRVGDRFKQWLRKNIPQFADKDQRNPPQTRARSFYCDFRNGLVHEGRVKNLSQFSLENDQLIKIEGRVMVVNPRQFLDLMEPAFCKYCSELKSDRCRAETLIAQLRKDFEQEIEYAKAN